MSKLTIKLKSYLLESCILENYHSKIYFINFYFSFNAEHGFVTLAEWILSGCCYTMMQTFAFNLLLGLFMSVLKETPTCM